MTSATPSRPVQTNWARMFIAVAGMIVVAAILLALYAFFFGGGVAAFGRWMYASALGARLPYDSLAALRAALAAAHPDLVKYDVIAPADPSVFAALAAGGGALERATFASPVADFYLTNPIARASRVMAECSALRARGAALQAAE